MSLRGVALERADRDRLIDLSTTAGILAGMGADTPENVCKGIWRSSQEVSLLIFRNPDGLDVSPAFRVNGTGGAAGNIPIEILLVRDRYAVAQGWAAFRLLLLQLLDFLVA